MIAGEEPIESIYGKGVIAQQLMNLRCLGDDIDLFGDQFGIIDVDKGCILALQGMLREPLKCMGIAV